MDRLALWDRLATVHAVVSETLAHRLEAEAALPLVEFLVLRRLAGAPAQRLRMSDLAARTPLTRSGITRLVDRMAADGLVERDTCPSDRRGSFAVLTRAGSAALSRATAVYEDTIAAAFGDHLDDDDVSAIDHALARVAGDDPPPPCA